MAVTLRLEFRAILDIISIYTCIFLFLKGEGEGGGGGGGGGRFR